MVATLETALLSGPLADELAELARRVQASVVAVRGTRNGGGSGVVWNEQGLVVTNHHVAPGERADVQLANGTRLPSRVIGRSEQLDLAALEIEGDPPDIGLTPATIGDSTRLRAGELVVAVGNPFGERNAVTLGIVSALGPVGGLEGRRDVIRAAITLLPGNSGGALADIAGRIVGIPHMVVGGDLALAVPSAVVQRFLLDVRGERAYFGLGGQLVELPAWLAERAGLTARQGFLLSNVVAGSPAERAGLMLGDVVVAVGGSGAGQVDLVDQLGSAPAGQPARLGVLRAGALHWFEVTPHTA